VDRVTVPEAARILGIKEESVRKRVSRGKLRADKDAEGRLLVWVDSTSTVRDESVTDRSGERDLLYEEMRERIAYLERQVEEEREARRRADTLLARLMDNIPALEPPADAPEQSQTSQEAAEEPAEAAPMPAPAQADTDAQRGVQRPWWRRMFRG
jgi:hypothetical protein